MPTQILTPDTIVTSANITAGTATTANLAAEDAAWATASGTTVASMVHVGFPTPPPTLVIGANLQTVTVQSRKVGGTGVPTFIISIHENNGAALISSTANSVSSTTGQTNTFTFNASVLSNSSGADAEVQVTTTVGGTGGQRASIDYGYIAWTADYAADSTPPSITSRTSFRILPRQAWSTTLTANETVTWAKTGGTNFADFTISGNTLSLPPRPPTQTYTVQVTATDTSNNSTPVTITVNTLQARRRGRGF
jgi:hypothetical protein